MSRSSTRGTHEVRPSARAASERDDERHHREADLALPRPLPPPLTHPFRVSGSTLGPVPQPRPVGVITRGTTNPNRLRRCDRWLAGSAGVAAAAQRPRPRWWSTSATAPPRSPPSSCTTGCGGCARTSRSSASRSTRPGWRPRARSSARGCASRVGGFEVPLPGGARPVVVRAFNVLRQYDESQVADAWATTVARLAPDGLLVDGTCDELGRLATWVAVTADGPVSLSLSWRLRGLERPGVGRRAAAEGADPPQRARRGRAPAAHRPRRGVGAAGAAGGVRHPAAVHRDGGGDAGCRVAGCSTARHAGGWAS